MRLVLLAPVVVLACKNSDYVGSVYAKVVDDRVELEMFGDPGTLVTLGDQPPAPLETYQRTRPVLPLDGFPDGPNTIEVRFEVRGKTHTLQATFTKPAGAGKPYLRLGTCGYPSNNPGSVAVKVEGGPLGRADHCWVWSDAAIRLRIEGPIGSAVTIGDQTATIGPDGGAELAVSLRGVILRAPVTTAIGDGAGLGLEVPVRLTRGETTLDGTLAIDVARAAKDLSRRLFTAVTTGVPLAAEAGGEAALAGDRQSLAYLPATAYRGPLHYGKATAVGAVGLVAIARDCEATAAPPCGPYRTTGGEASAMAPRQLVDIEVDVFDAATGARLTTRAFSADHEACPMFATSSGGSWQTIESRPDAKIVARWLTQIAEKGAIP